MTVFVMTGRYYREATRGLLDHYDEFKEAVWNSYAGRDFFEALSRCEADDLCARIAYCRVLMLQAGYSIDDAVDYFNTHAAAVKQATSIVEEARARRVQ